MIELGQPMHAYDVDKLSDKLEVRFAETGESINLLEKSNVDLKGDTLIIGDSKGPVAIIWARFTPVIRTGIYLAAGTARYKVSSFILLDLLTSVILCPPICLLGYISYGELQKLEAGVNTLQVIIALAILVIISIAAFRYFWVKWEEAKDQNPTT